MKKIALILLCLACASQLLGKPNYSSHELIARFSEKVVFKDGTTGIDAFDSFLDQFGVQSSEPIIEKPDLHIYKFTCEKEIDFSAIIELFQKDESIIYTQPNYLNEMLSITPNDPYYYKQWGLPAINADNAWEIEKGNEQVIIAIIDSGIEYDHPDLEQNIWINHGEIPDNYIDDDQNGYIDDWMGWDFTETNIIDAMGDFRERDNDPRDDLGHGTHIAGIISAQTNNHIGVSGTTWFVKCMNLRAGFRTTLGGYLEDDDVSAAIVYAADNGAQIISISWGDVTLAPIINDACNYAYDLGVSIIASAGNEGGVGLLYPAALDNVISVTAVDSNLKICSFSSYGEGIDLCGPGLSIYSTYLHNEYKNESGTSMSAPFVAGCAGLLLSQNPLLSNIEVYNLINISCDDLGENGYDNVYGYGIINAEKLMLNAGIDTKPQSAIFYPPYNSGYAQDIPIIGTAYCENFFCYTLGFTTKQEPVENDWLDVITHNPEPTLYTDPVIDDTLGTFLLYGIRDSTYYIRLSVKDIHGTNYIDIVKISVDRTPPQFVENATATTYRYDFDMKDYYILSTATEPSQFYATCFSADADTFSLIQKKYDYFTTLILPQRLPDESYSFSLSIQNNAGLTATSGIFADAITIDNSTIPTSGFDPITSYAHSVYLCSNNYDINGNGKIELVFMEFPDEGSYGPVRFCEYDNTELEVVHTMNNEFIPWSIGDTDADGNHEILGNQADSMIIFEAENSTSFPSRYVNSIKDAYTGTFYDFNNDGIDDIVIRSADIIGTGTYSHYDVYSRSGDNFNLECMILDNTHTYSRNELSPYIRFGDLNNDGKRNILFSDIDGDILIYQINNNYSVERIDSLKIPIPNAYYNAIGDFDGDGLLEFIVGGYADGDDVNNQFWLYGVYKYIDGNPTLLDYIEIAGVSSNNGLSVGDLDGDGADEIVIAAAPDIYIFKLIETAKSYDVVPQWVGSSYRTYQPVCVDADNDGQFEAAFNQYDANDSLMLVLSSYPTDPPAPSTLMPQNFFGRPLNEHLVSFTWNAQIADSFYLYKEQNQDIEMTAIPGTETSYSDTNVIPDSLYKYCLSALKDGQESYKTLPLEVIPIDPPTLLSIQMVSLNSILLNFDKTLHKDCEQVSNFYVDIYGYPESVIPTNSQLSLLMTFAEIFDETDSPFTIDVENIVGIFNTSMADTLVTFMYQEDLTRPYIVSSTLENDKEVHIEFNETVDHISAEDASNYTLLFPEQAAVNSISQIQVNNESVTLTLAHKIKPVGEPYFIKIFNVTDLAGNCILPGKNLIKITIPITDLDNVTVFPNPVTIENKVIYFQNLPTSGSADFYIFDLAGNLVNNFTAEFLSEDYNRAEWNLSNQSGKKVASGMYFYLIKYFDLYKKGKIAIIR